MEHTVMHNEAESRFEVALDNKVAVVDYRKMNGVYLAVTHTGVPKEYEGQGIAAKLTKALLDYARANGLKVKPLCSYARVYMDRHPEYEDLRV